MQIDYLYNVIGSIGVILIVGSYLLLTIHRLSSTDLIYSVLNAAGATMIILSLLHNFNLAAFLIELFWLVISIIGIVLALKARMNSQSKNLQT